MTIADCGRRMDWLRGRNHQLREAAAATQRLTVLVAVQGTGRTHHGYAQVIGRDLQQPLSIDDFEQGRKRWYPERYGSGAFRCRRAVVKTTGATSVVLLVTDPNNAIAGLIQRTRDEGIVEGTPQGRAKLKYIPMLSSVKEGDQVVTSGLVGGFPRGLAIGRITAIDREEGALFQTAELAPEVDVNHLEEVLVIQTPHGESAEAVRRPDGGTKRQP